MKKIKILFFVLTLNFFTFLCSGQVTYSHYIDYSSRWNYMLASVYYNYSCNTFSTNYSLLTYYISGDSLIGTNWYYKLYIQRRDSIVCPSGYTLNNYGYFLFCIREDSLKRILIADGIGNPDGILMDFNLSVGDTIKGNPISSIDTVWLGSTPLKRFNINCIPNSYLIEGVGANTSLFNPHYCSSGIEYSDWIICYQKQNDLLQIDTTYQCGLYYPTRIESLNKHKNITIYPNPNNGKFTITQSVELNSIEVLNLLGESIYFSLLNNVNTNVEIDLSSATKGIYFIKINAGEKVYVDKVVLN